MGALQNFQKFRVRVWKCHRTSRTSGYWGTGIQNSQKFRAGTSRAVPVPRVLWHGSSRTHKSSRYGYQSLNITSRSSRYGYESLTKLPQVPGRYKHALPVPRVFVAPAYRTSRSFGYGHECPTEVTEVLCRVIPVVNKYPGYGFVCALRTE